MSRWLWQQTGKVPRRAAAAVLPGADEATTRALAQRMEAAAQRRLGRSLALRHVDAGGCGGCERELRALAALVVELRRFGLSFVVSPHHADVLLVSGALTVALQPEVLRLFDALPDPKWVVAVGDCAIDGGVFKGSYAVEGGIGAALPVDLIVRGCPPSPAQVLAGLLALLEANRD